MDIKEAMREYLELPICSPDWEDPTDALDSTDANLSDVAKWFFNAGQESIIDL